MALYHIWDVKNDFAYVLQFFSFISDGLGGVHGVIWELRMEPAGLHPLRPYSPIVQCLDLKQSILWIFGCNCIFENKNATLEKKLIPLWAHIYQKASHKSNSGAHYEKGGVALYLEINSLNAQYGIFTYKYCMIFLLIN